MNKQWMGIVAAAALGFGAGAYAQNAPDPGMQTPPPSSSPDTAPANGSPPPSSTEPAKPSKHQLMKDCLAREKAKNDGSTKMQMRKTCKAEVKSVGSSM